MSSIDKIFSEEHLLGYSDACLNLATNIPEKRKHSQFDTLVIPSRGAVPFFLGMRHALTHLSELGFEHKDFLEGLENSPLLPLLGERVTNYHLHGEIKTKVLLIPFTADLNIGQYTSGEDVDEYTKRTRDFWSKVTASFFLPPESRAKNPYFHVFTKTVLEDIEGRTELASYYRQFPTVQRCGLIDTVISGRAANDILKSFDHISASQLNPDMQPTTFLIIDENGRKLKQTFKNYLKRKELSSQLEMLYVPRIVSEDEGASLLGVAATVYPSIMQASKNLTYLGHDFFIGAGSWRSVSDLNHDPRYKHNFDMFMRTICRGVDYRFAENFLADGNDKLSKFRQARKTLVEHLERETRSYDANPDVLRINKRYKIVNPYETHSHVVHIPFDVESTTGIIESIHSTSSCFGYKVKEESPKTKPTLTSR